MRDEAFRFKQFSCSHSKSSIKIGVDAVLIGAWADVRGEKILDVGTGCGVIALMCAQRNPGAKIEGIDIDPFSIDEASLNFKQSPWHLRLKAKLQDFTVNNQCIYDLIISNPPFFDSGINNPNSTRLKARHQDSLSPKTLLEHGVSLLAEDGRISMIIPFSQEEYVIDEAQKLDMYPFRICRVKGHPEAPIKRSMIEFVRHPVNLNIMPELLVLHDKAGNPSFDYQRLCKDFYLKF